MVDDDENKALIHYGDLVYFSVPSEGLSEELIWTSAVEQVPNFQLQTQAEVRDPVLSLFVIEPFERKEGFLGEIVKPGSSLQLLHLLTNTWVSVQANPVTFKLTLSADSASEISLSISTSRSGIEEGVKHLDVVSINPKTIYDSLFCLCTDFWFIGGGSDTFRIHRFAAHQSNDGNLHYGMPFRLKWNSMYLSVKPNFTSSSPLILEETDQKAEFLTEESCFPEYSGELTADVTTDFDDGNDIWACERTDRFQGGNVKLKEDCFIRHLGSGRYLTSGMRLVLHRFESCLWNFQRDIDTSECIVREELNLRLTNNNAEVLVHDDSSSLESLKASIFLNIKSSELAYKRLVVSNSKISSPSSPLIFTVEEVRPDIARWALALSHYRTVLPGIRLVLQNITQIADVSAALSAIDTRVSLQSLMVTTAKEPAQANLIIDYQIGNEVLRIWALKKANNPKFKSSFSTQICFRVLKSLLYSFQTFPRFLHSLFARKHFMSELLEIAPFHMCKLLLPSVRVFSPAIVNWMYWTEAIAVQPQESQSFDEYINISSFCYHLLKRLPIRLSFTAIPVLTLGSEFVLRIQKPETGIGIWSFGVFRTIGDVGEKLSTFVEAMLCFAASICVNSQFTEEIIVGMGLELEKLIELFAECQDKPKIQIGVITFIALVYIPQICSPTLPLSVIDSSRLLSESALIDPFISREHPQDIYSFVVPESRLCHLIRYEVNFWLCELLSHTEDETGQGEELLTAHLAFVRELLNFRSVGDVFAVTLAECATGVAKNMLHSVSGETIRNSAKKMEFLIEFFRFMDVFQQWKRLRVIQRLYSLEDRSVGAEDIARAVSAFQSVSVLQGFLTASSATPELNPSDSTLSKVLRILMGNPDQGIRSLVLALLAEMPDQLSQESHLLESLLTHETEFPTWTVNYLTQLSDESPVVAFLAYPRTISQINISLYDLQTKSSEDVPSLPDYLNSLDSLYETLSCLKSPTNLTRFQEILEKVNFLREIEKMWRLATYLEGEEESSFVELKTLVMDVTRMYCQDNASIQSSLLPIIASQACFLDYPQYIKLLKVLKVFPSSSEFAARTALYLISSAASSELKRPLLSLQLLLEDQETLSVYTTTIVQHFTSLQTPVLTSIQWEILLTVLKSIPSKYRIDVFGSLLSRWYLSDPTQIRREGAALLTYSSDTRNPLFHAGLQETVSHLTQALGAEHILDAHFKLSHYAKIQRMRNSEKGGSDLLYILELIWHKESGLISQIPGWMRRISLQDLMTQLAQLYLCLPSVEALEEQVQRLATVLKLYTVETDDQLHDEDRDILVAACLKDVEIYDPGEDFEPNLRTLKGIFHIKD